MNFTLAAQLLTPLQDHVRQWGKQDKEAGGFLLGSGDGSSAHVLALAEGVGIERSRGVFRVSGKALEQLFAWAEVENCRVWAQVHSHPRGSFLSDTDERYGFRVEGFISAVIPDYATPPRTPDAWGWWTFAEGIWQSVGAPSVTRAETRIVVFDEEGVK